MALRQCIGCHIFEEPSPEHYRHNENSRMLLNENYASWLEFRVDDGLLAGAYLTKSVMANNGQIPDIPSKRAFGLAFQSPRTAELPFYEYYKYDKARGARFSKAMAACHESKTFGVLVSSLQKLKQNATIVDVGGGRGNNSIRLARHYNDMSFIVQDLYDDVGCFRDSHSMDSPHDDVRGRIRWMTHDFYEQQPVMGADMYLLSHVLMDHQFQ
ncbi:hypothetical protein EYZ11_013018 [Aspergillus tanneri]|uniref:O-methyltransferase C-terminal domain-containing protein n=1 Tax=Aspergillus tanneri TaxID=1220188 RepID=A0A4S3J0V3_9EURO|nr:hypothetical protein EYZ11_013018 [Aspergillus tanneri]